MESSSSSGGSLKRGKAAGNGSQVANCLVDGCNEDLSKCRDYHRRHKVCEIHSKTAKVTVGGQELRFCQQCSRFHPLSEFDEGKRSCRKRLDGHNKRRRKPQPDTFNNSTSTMLYSSSSQVAGSKQLLHFGGSQRYPNVDVHEEMLYSNPSHINHIDSRNMLRDPSSHDYKEPNRFPFLQGGDHALPEATVSQRVFPGGFDQTNGSCDGALSLLSSVPGVTREIGFSHEAQQPGSSQPLAHGLHFDGYSQFSFPQETETKHGLHLPEMFENTPDGSSSSGSHQTLTFRWE
ncbi:unnamed protein product [Cuscuta europaea]|uniref:SBP-type domain-containing protein n=1 Tax=Cuscuta europaea TaxID=41803 RepID=A0A9P0ZW87_CUSEU|nr:unnamed protein product [Cuscuta europaea]